MIRQLAPGDPMRLGPGCGHHCGIRSSAEEGNKVRIIGHCECPECQCPQAGSLAVSSG